MMPLCIAFFFFLVLSLAAMMFLTRPTDDTRKVQRRLAAISTLARSAEGSAEVGDPSNPAEPRLSERVESMLAESVWTGWIPVLLSQAKSSWSSTAFVLRSLAFGAATGMLVLLASRHLTFALAAILPGMFLPFLWFQRKRARYLLAFDAALPDAIELMGRALQAGHSVQQMIEVASEQAREPVATEFTQVHHEQSLGIPFREAILALSQRIPSQDLRFVVTAILVQKETGGDLIQILERTTHVIRERLRLQGEIRTFTAQGRFTGWILSLLPLIMLTAVSLINPSYTTILFHDPLGQKLLWAGAGMLVVGGLIIRRVVDVEV